MVFHRGSRLAAAGRGCRQDNADQDIVARNQGLRGGALGRSAWYRGACRTICGNFVLRQPLRTRPGKIARRARGHPQAWQIGHVRAGTSEGGEGVVKVAVYTIALNEAANAERWANSAADADYRIVADTGSTDDTVERLTAAGVTVHRIAIRPWRFDTARNAAMALIPDDVDVCCTMDMDRSLEPGWRPKLEAAWTPEMTALFCQTVYRSSVDNPTPLRSFPTKNFHHRWGYRFKRAVHEALVFSGEKEVTGSCDDIVMSEVQDHAKPTRSNYLPLMEIAHKEEPDDGQICFWLGRDLMWANQHERAIHLLKHYLSLPASIWGEERSEAMRYIARMQPQDKLLWLDKARIEAPHRREIWLDLAEEFHGRADWLNLFWACANGIEKTRRTGSYLDDASCWGFRLFDLGAIASWRLNAMERAVEWGQKALELDQNNQRLKDNLDFFVRRREEVSLRK
ncbi:glycosyltransferase [Mesorhizobium sp. M2D.F.Ca.ET.185.01.1.1]|nr:glycosyltransferase [Mesorhizobium sp. M2D.F.Ca.ET.140.01.1.1]TGP14168.1 glycosyltransferase [Mesorhizobium sp. M2D.F.Ca.ET.233.01.1.1]TGP29970.1 glycosyltransferase [Mesorhizobium sp. M2D.F.Ca.ET.232.01.1.1]TGP54715.1 glycosyltransferase [Mesorhizobium sp. M2D.F.Ca.ET.226.01.1.1]TGP63649.1 glycosyltransferase [Mesorhizobium sp. M2D.F.Ca.ET.225.01.1.1]TGP73109.1 glycosyltransferase [Mesorhizobium sp. M2D.F.Ca.ET.224.01.1.1]TGP73872.1 glycosyltransferase [bacterium M00.F.Ca.ET.227.01.1.1]T